MGLFLFQRVWVGVKVGVGVTSFYEFMLSLNDLDK